MKSIVSVALFVFVILTANAFAQTLPAKVSSYLTKNYSGWKQTAVANGCYSSFKKSVVVGDFDSNGKRDYAVKFTHGRKGYILAFLAKGANFNPYLLESGSATEIKNMGLSMGRKGERIENEDGDSYSLQDDSPMIGVCESHAGIYSFRNGDFKAL